MQESQQSEMLAEHLQNYWAYQTGLYDCQHRWHGFHCDVPKLRGAGGGAQLFSYRSLRLQVASEVVRWVWRVQILSEEVL